MSKIHEKIMKADFAKNLKKLIIIAVCVMLLGGGFSVAMLRTQIGEVVSYVNQREQMKEYGSQDNENEQNVENKGQNDDEQNAENKGQNDDEQNVENKEQNNDGQNGKNNGQDNENEQDGENYGEDRKRGDGLNYRGEKEGRRDGEHDFFENIAFTQPTAAAVITVGITVLCGILLLLWFWLLVAAWLYQAAEKSGMNGLLWMAAGMIGNVYAVVIFLLFRSFTRKKCPSCGAFLPVKTQHCTRCGAAMHEKCAGCGETCAAGSRFCHACGKQLHGKNEDEEKNKDKENNENNDKND